MVLKNICCVVATLANTKYRQDQNLSNVLEQLYLTISRQHFFLNYVVWLATFKKKMYDSIYRHLKSTLLHKSGLDLQNRSFLVLKVSSVSKQLRASLPKIDGKVAHVKFCFHKIHVSLDLGIKTEPTPPIKMGGHAPRGKIADPPISRVQNRNFTFLLLEPQDEEVLKK